MIGAEGLHQHPAPFRPAARAAGHLRDQLKRPFGGAEVGQVQGRVGVDHADQRDVGKIEPLGDHLRAQQDAHLARAKRRQRPLVAAVAPASCRCPSAGSDVRESGPGPRPPAAACPGRGSGCRRSRTPGSRRAPAPRSRNSGTARSAAVRWCVSAMSHCGQRTTWPQAGHWMCVEKPRRFSSRITCPPSSSAASMAACSCRLIAPRLRRSRAARRADRSCPPPAAAGRTPAAASRPARYSPVCGPVPALQRRRGRAEHQRNRFGRGPGHGHVAGVIARRGLLLERRLVLFVQHDQPQVRRGGEDRAAGADHHRHLARRRSAASANAARRRSSGCAARPRRRTAGETARPSAASG